MNVSSEQAELKKRKEAEKQCFTLLFRSKSKNKIISAETRTMEEEEARLQKEHEEEMRKMKEEADRQLDEVRIFYDTILFREILHRV